MTSRQDTVTAALVPVSRDGTVLGFFAMIFLETERLLFRSHQGEDEADFIGMQTDAEVRRYVGGQAWSLEKAQRRFRNEYLGRPRESYGLWATILKAEQKYVGCCGLRAAPDQNSAYLGYFLARPYWGKGFASEASKAFMDAAFNRFGLPRLLADVEQGHAASEHILRKFGFTFFKEEKIAESNRVILFYELLRSEWEQRTLPLKK